MCRGELPECLDLNRRLLGGWNRMAAVEILALERLEPGPPARDETQISIAKDGET
jgi:hypothetical protein